MLYIVPKLRMNGQELDPKDPHELKPPEGKTLLAEVVFSNGFMQNFDQLDMVRWINAPTLPYPMVSFESEAKSECNVYDIDKIATCKVYTDFTPLIKKPCSTNLK